MKKRIILFLITLLSIVLGLTVFTACESKDPKAETPIFTESSKTVELGADDDLVYGVDWKNGTLIEVKKGQVALTAANYESDENSLTVKGTYVSALTEGTHTFTLVTDGGSADFTIIVNDSRPANPTVTADKTGAFNTLDPDELVTYTVNWGKGSFVKLEVEGQVEALEKDNQYVVDGNKLSIAGQGFISEWAADTYTFTLTTTTGSASFDLVVVMSGSRYLDDEVFKIAENSDVSFDILIGSDTEISSVTTNNTVLDASAYSYSIDNAAFSIKADYLATLSAGIHEFEITLDDMTTYKVSTAVKTIMAENFENDNIVSPKLSFNPDITSTSINDADAISGKSVKIDCKPGWATVLVSVNNIQLQAGKSYIINTTVRIDDATQIIFTDYSNNYAWMNADGTLSTQAGQYVDSRSTSTEISDGIFNLNIYLPITKETSTLYLLYRNIPTEDIPEGAVNTKLVIDNIYIVENSSETFLPASKATVSPEYQEIPSIKDVNVTVENNYATFVSVTENNVALTANDYTIDGTTLTIKGDYLKARNMTIGQTLTFSYNTVNPDNQNQSFATTFRVKLNATVWGSVYEKEYDGTNDVSFDVIFGETSGVTVKLGANELTANDFVVTVNSITVKAAYLNTLEANKVYQFVLTDSNNNQFRFAIYVGCTAQNVLYFSFENGVLPSGENLGVAMSRTLNENGFDGKSATLSGGGTAVYINRSGFTSADYVTMPMTVGDTYEFSMSFKFAESGKPVAGASNDYGVLGGNTNVVFAFGNGNWGAKYAHIDVDANGELTLGKLDCVQNNTSLIKDDNGVYTLVLTFVATGSGDLQVPCWNSCTFDIDNIILRKVPGIPTISDGIYIFDKSVNTDIIIPVNMHGSTLSEIRINDAALATSDYILDGGELILHAAKLTTYETDAELSLTIVSNVGTSIGVTVKIVDAAPFLTGDSECVYDPYEALESIGLDSNGKIIKEIKVGESVVPTTAYTYDDSTKSLSFTESYLSTLTGTVEHIVTFENTTSEIKFNIVINSPLFLYDFEDGVLPSGENLGIGLSPSLNENGFNGKSVTLSGSGTVIYVNRPGFDTADYVNVPITLGGVYQFSMSFKFAESGKPVAGTGNDWGVLGGNSNVVFAFLDTSAAAKYAHIDVDTNGELVLNKLYCVDSETSLTKDSNDVYTFVLTFVAAGSGDLQVPCWNNCTFDVDNIIIRKVLNSAKIPDEISLIDVDFEDGVLPSGENLGVAMSRTLNENGFDGKSATLSGSGTALFINRSGYSAASYITAPMIVGQTYEFSMSFKFAENGEPVAGAGNDWSVLGGNTNVVFAFGNGSWGAKYAHIDVDANGELTLGKLDCVQDNTSLIKDDNGVYTLVLTFVATGSGDLQVPCWNSCTFDIDNIAMSHIL